MANPPASIPAVDRPSGAAKFEGGIIAIISAVAIGIHLHLVSVGWDASLMGFHSFRQAQTGLLIRQFVENGVNWNSPLPIFGPPWYLPFEFPLYQATAAGVAQLFNLPVEQAARATSLAYLYLGLVAVYRILGEVSLPTRQRWLILALLLVTPTYLYYARSALIESCAWAISWWFLWAFLKGAKTGGTRWVSLAVVTGILAGLVKITTFAAFLIPAGLYTLLRIYQTTRPPEGAWIGEARRAILMVLPGMLLAAGWIWWGDALKQKNDLAAVLVSGSLREFSLGTLDLRLSAEFWSTMGRNVRTGLLHPVGWLLLSGAFFSYLRDKRLLLGLLAAGFLGAPLVFANLYFVHDYYYYATGSFLIVAVGIIVQSIPASKPIALAGKYGLWVLLLTLQIQGYSHTHLPDQKAGGSPVPELASFIKQAIGPDEVVLTFGEDWNPTLTYFSERDTVMVMYQKFGESEQINAVLNRLGDRPVTALVATGGIRNYPDFLNPYLQRFDLYNKPVALSDNTSIYLERSAVIRIFENWSPGETAEFTLQPRKVRPLAIPQQTITPAVLENATWPTSFAPRPARMDHPFGLSIAPLGDELVLDAHPPTDIRIPVAAGQWNLTLDFGMKPGTYSSKNDGSDGVEFLLDIHTAEGVNIPLATIYLTPRDHPAERGTQSASYRFALNHPGELRIGTRAGPAQNPNFDWAYLRGWNLTRAIDRAPKP